MAALANPPKGDLTWNLARALVGAWLNVSAGNESACIADIVDSAVSCYSHIPSGAAYRAVTRHGERRRSGHNSPTTTPTGFYAPNTATTRGRGGIRP